MRQIVDQRGCSSVTTIGQSHGFTDLRPIAARQTIASPTRSNRNRNAACAYVFRLDATLCPAFVQKVRGRASLGYSLSYDLSYVKTTSNTRERLVHLGKENLTSIHRSPPFVNTCSPALPALRHPRWSVPESSAPAASASRPAQRARAGGGTLPCAVSQAYRPM